MFDFAMLIKAMVCGGLLCVIAQILIDKTKLTPARILVLYVVLGVFFGAVGLYKPFYEFAGAGATVPLTGFGYNIANGVREAIDLTDFSEYSREALLRRRQARRRHCFSGILPHLFSRESEDDQSIRERNFSMALFSILLTYERDMPIFSDICF